MSTRHYWELASIGRNWSLSAKWSSQQLQCTLNGIKQGCKGVCCLHSVWSPVKINKVIPGNACPFLDPHKGRCSFTIETRPVVCMLFPFILNKNNKLCLHGRCLMGCCKPNRKPGPTILECQKTQLTALFGGDVYEKMIRSVISGVDIAFEAPPIVVNSLQEEFHRIQNNMPPATRQEMAQIWVNKSVE